MPGEADLRGGGAGAGFERDESCPHLRLSPVAVSVFRPFRLKTSRCNNDDECQRTILIQTYAVAAVSRRVLGAATSVMAGCVSRKRRTGQDETDGSSSASAEPDCSEKI